MSGYIPAGWTANLSALLELRPELGDVALASAASLAVMSA